MPLWNAIFVRLWLLLALLVLDVTASAQTSATSADGAWSVDALTDPGVLLVRDAKSRIARRYPLATLDGKHAARAAKVYLAEPRKSFVIVLAGVPEMWELSYRPDAEPIYDGYVHDYKMGEGIVKLGFLGVRRIPLDNALDTVMLDTSSTHVFGTVRATHHQPAEIHVINLNIRRRIDRIPLPASPKADGCVNWQWRETTGRYCAP
jgi:hypothetical protein